METLGPFKGMYRVIVGVILGSYRDNGKENGNYYKLQKVSNTRHTAAVGLEC